jgi:hypothetical protein
MTCTLNIKGSETKKTDNEWGLDRLFQGIVENVYKDLFRAKYNDKMIQKSNGCLTMAV